MNVQILGLLIYGFFVLIGGIIGYIKADSLPSLVMGITFSFLIAFAALGMLYNKEWGMILAKVLATFLLLFFAYRFSLSYNVMPSGIMAFLSLGALLLLFRK